MFFIYISVVFKNITLVSAITIFFIIFCSCSNLILMILKKKQRFQGFVATLIVALAFGKNSFMQQITYQIISCFKEQILKRFVRSHILTLDYDNMTKKKFSILNYKRFFQITQLLLLVFKIIHLIHCKNPRGLVDLSLFY